MMLKYSFSLNKASSAIENAIQKVLSEGYITHDLEGDDNKKYQPQTWVIRLLKN